jgi:glycosidase
MTTRGTPLLYYGDELAMAGGADPDNRRDFPGGFPGDTRNAFTKAGRTATENDVFEHLKRLAELRRELVPLRKGRLLHVYDEEQQTAFARVWEGWPSIITVFNNDTKPATISLNTTEAGWHEDERVIDRLGVIKDTLRVKGGRVTLTLPARSASILVAPRPAR